MPKSEFQFSDFLLEVSDSSKDFVLTIHKMMEDASYKIKLELKANGFLVSYSEPKTKKSILNFVFRKNGMYIRIYGNNCNAYADLLHRLPENIVTQIDKSGDCSRLLDPQKCNSRCALGYDFSIGGKRYQKCRLVCFFLFVDAESIPYLLELVEKEMQERA